MNKRILLFSVCLITIACLQAQTGHFFHSDRFSSSLICDLCQDREGVIWIATDYGLNRFDGYHFQTFLHEEGDTTSIQTNTVVSLLCDRQGRLWVGTNRGLDRYDYGMNKFVHYSFPENHQPRISSILQLHDGTILVGTAGYGAYTVEDRSLKLKPYATGQAFFSRVLEDSKGRLWRSGFDDVVSCREGQKITSFQLEGGNPQTILETDGEVLIVCQHNIMSFSNGQMTVADIDMSAVEGKDVIFSEAAINAHGDIYIGTRGRGTYRIPATKPRKLERVVFNAQGINPLTAKISAVMFDHKGNLWLGCHRKGLLMVPQRPMQFGNWSFEMQGINLGSTISSVCEGADGIVWSTVQGVGVYGFNQTGQVVAHPAAPEAVEFIFKDRQQRYWIGTDDGLFAYNPTTGQSRLEVTFECDMFNDMTSDDEGNIYISTFSRGFCVYNPKTQSLRNYNMNDSNAVRGTLCNNWVMGMSADSKGVIWLATSAGVACFDPKTESFRTQGWEVLLDGIVCFDVCELRRGQLVNGHLLEGDIAIGTEQGLYLYDRKKRQVERFPGSEQLSNKCVCYIVQGNDGDIWCSTSQGIWQYELDNGRFIGHINGNGLTQKEYLYGVGMHTDDDHIYFGHNDGFTVFTPRDIKENLPQLDSLQLVAVRVGEQYIDQHTVLNGVEVTNKPVNQSSYFTLSYLDHTVMLAFSQMNFDDPMNVILEYRVNGGSWIPNQAGQNTFTLGHLQPGTYRVEVRAHVAGSDYTPVKMVIVIVKAPWYRSLPAYFVYFMLLAAIIAYILYNYRRRTNQQLNEEKMKFLINATHDIRSPLTLIMNPLANLKRHIGTEQKDATRDIATIEHNAKRILNLVNQILDIRKIDKQQMRLHCQQTDLIAFVVGIQKMFDYNAKERNIQFNFHHEGLERLDVWVDPGQFDKVVTNLLSNAFKYCQDGGTIDISLSSEQGKAKLEVADNGTGLDGDLKHIFDRFYQGKNSRQLHIDGTGIGLNLCKMIVDMHQGTIQACNRTDGRGAVFTVLLPLGTDHLKAEEKDTPQPQTTGTANAPATADNTENDGTSDATDSDGSPVASATTVGKDEAPAHQKAQTSPKHRILVVDDDVELAQYIAADLNRHYKVTIAANGREALRELLAYSAEGRTVGESSYDLVVSDVMMPEMDGFTLLRMVKTNINISHIPVIMLTSKADVANRLEGLERGADAFMAKPFEMQELHLLIDNLIHNRQRLKGKFSGAQQQADKLVQPEVKGNDEQLMERIMKAVNKNLSDSDFNVDMLTREVGISRAQLHRKMKELTGISTSEFIRNIRLEQAARLLREQKINVTQVAYTVGFSNLAHFSTIFRKHFGISPSEYAEKSVNASEDQPAPTP